MPLRIILVLLLGVTLTASGVVSFSRAAPLPSDTLRYLPVANEAVFLTMGARVWTLHVPVEMLEKKARFVVKVAADGGAPKEVLAGRLKPTRPAEALDVTFVIYSDNPTNHNAKVLHLALASGEFYDRRTMANPVRNASRFMTPNDTGDLTKGILLARLSSDENDGRAEFSLWTE